MPARITERDIEHMRQVADECDYDLHTIARRMCVSFGAALDWSGKKWLTRNGESLKAAKARRADERIIRLAEQFHGDVNAVARAASMTQTGARTAMTRAGLDAKRRVAMAKVRWCTVCGAPFQNLHPRARLCSKECKNRNEAERQRILDCKRRGVDPHAPTKREILEPQYRDMLWRTFGNIAAVARDLGCSITNVRQSIDRWGLRGYVAMCRASECDPQRLAEIIRDADWSIAAACRAHKKRKSWFREMCAKADALHLVAQAPCLECGRMCPRARMGGSQIMCSKECALLRQRRRKKRSHEARKARMAQQHPACDATRAAGDSISQEAACINRSPSSAASAATPK